MDADYSIEVKTFFKQNNSSVATVPLFKFVQMQFHKGFDFIRLQTEIRWMVWLQIILYFSVHLVQVVVQDPSFFVA